VAVVALVSRGTRHADLSHPPSGIGSPDPEAAAGDLLVRLQRGLATADRRALLRLADPSQPGSGHTLAALLHNVRSLRLTDLTLRYIDASSVPLSAADRDRYGARAWVSDVQVSWRPRGVDRSVSTLEVPLVLDWQGDRAVFDGALLASGHRVPLWLLDRLVVRRSADTLVLATTRRDADVVERQAAVAVATIRRSVPTWRRPLVVEVPADRKQFEGTSGLSPADARAIAAVTTTTDGSLEPTSPVHIYLNPPVFDPLGPRGQQIVVSHEAGHVALGAATTSLPLWLSEGMADYLALVHTDLPVRTLAAQILSLVRKQGPPRELPGTGEFAGSNPDIGASYEAAWLAVRLLGEQHGTSALLRFYRTADRDGDTRRAFAQVLGTDESTFVQQWRHELVQLAG
jgi:hypothetical protein